MQDEGSGEAGGDSSLVSHTTTRRVMKHFLHDTKTVSNEAVACLSKATEHFMLHFIGEVKKSADRQTGTASREAQPSSTPCKELKYDDVVRVVHADPLCEFLGEIIPNVTTDAANAAFRQRPFGQNVANSAVPQTSNQGKKQRLR